MQHFVIICTLVTYNTCNWQLAANNIMQEMTSSILNEITKKNMHIFDFNWQLIFSYKQHLELKWFRVALNKLHMTLVTNVNVIVISSHRQWMKYIFELTIFFIYWLYNICNYYATNDQFLMIKAILPCGTFK
jgi:hypothetical protein